MFEKYPNNFNAKYSSGIRLRKIHPLP